MRVNAVRSPGV